MSADGIYIGLMSGTSADAIDAAAVSFDSGKITLLGTHSAKLPLAIRQAIHQLATPGANEIDQLGELDIALGRLFADCVNALIGAIQLDPSAVKAIGSHGQTIRHRPPGMTKQPFTLQIGDPNTIAQLTAITTIADFRRRDMAAGGQGAPLVPAFHHAAFHSHLIDRVVINIGGIANISWLPASGAVSGFDSGPGNMLMDAWIMRHQGKAYDASGAWAATGAVIEELLQRSLAHPYFSQQAPKSTGRELFNLSWLDALLASNGRYQPQDVQATLLELTAQTIAKDVTKLLKGEAAEIYICGGGAYNDQLINALQSQLDSSPITSTSQLGIAPEWIEAVAFAWLAKQTLNHQPGNLCAVTGARKEVILGGIYIA